MVQNINLYIGGKEVFFSEPPEILYTFQRTDYTNPTVIKNNFTKTVTIEGTPENNKVFNELFLLGRTQSEQLFNPAKRVDFELFVNGTMTETGYAKLDDIVRTGHKIEYNITLYGGLGDFFYGLSYGFDYDRYNSDVEQTEDEELKLKDLTYYSPYADDDTEFDFPITKDAVHGAWAVLASDESPTGDDVKWDYINFAPAYNGIPDDFDAERELINVTGYTAYSKYSGGCRLSVPSGSTVTTASGTYTYSGATIVTSGSFPTMISRDGKTYTPYNGFAMANLRVPMTEWDARDLRSYLQRPVLRVKGLVEAIQRYALEKGGYTLNLDSDFFNNTNPYYDKAWITLPLLQNLNGENAEREVEGGGMLGLVFDNETEETPSSITGYSNKRVTTTFNVVGFPTDVDYFKGGSMTISLQLSAAPAYSDPYGIRDLQTSYYEVLDDDGFLYGGAQFYSAYDVQLVAYDELDNIVNTSKHYIFTSQVTKETGEKISMVNLRFNTGLPNRRECIYHYGYFRNPQGTSSLANFAWYGASATSGVTISLQDSDVQYSKMKLIVKKHSTYNTDFYNKCQQGHPGTGTFTMDYYRTLMNWNRQYIFPWTQNDYNIGVIKSSMTYKPTANDNMRSNQLISKKKLLSQDGTPAAFLIDYCKLFNLYFDKDPIDKVITIRTRDNFYGNNVIDLEDKIDRTKEIKILPTAAANKWYTFNFTQGDRCEFEKKYYNTWGTDFGKQKVKTEYNFDNSSKDLLEGNKYANGAMVLEQSRFNGVKKNNGQTIAPFLYEWSEYKLFDQSTSTVDTTDEYNITLLSTMSQDPYRSDLGSTYDFYPKLQLHSNNNEPIDGSNILVFFNGMKETVASGGTSVYYNITDDLAAMFIDGSDTPCWLFTKDTYDMYGVEIAKQLLNANSKPILPVFSRYMMTGNEITKTWDFGRCNELFVPNIEYGDEPTIYEQWWKNYIADLYNVNTRVVECYVKLDGQVEGFWLKRFYYFDDSIWCLTKIEDYNTLSFDTTKCTFVKVADISNYHD